MCSEIDIGTRTVSLVHNNLCYLLKNSCLDKFARNALRLITVLYVSKQVIWCRLLRRVSSKCPVLYRFSSLARPDVCHKTDFPMNFKKLQMLFDPLQSKI